LRFEQMGTYCPGLPVFLFVNKWTMVEKRVETTLKPRNVSALFFSIRDCCGEEKGFLTDS
jgi:hypothetical protein